MHLGRNGHAAAAARNVNTHQYSAALGTKVTVVEKRETMLNFGDQEIAEALRIYVRDLSVTFRIGEDPAVPRRGNSWSRACDLPVTGIASRDRKA